MPRLPRSAALESRGFPRSPRSPRGSAPDKRRLLTRRPPGACDPVRSRSWTCAPPSAEVSIFSPPPVDSATRRAMSSPRPVDPAPLLPRRTAAPVSAIPCPASATRTRTMSSPRCSVTANPVPSAVCLKMLPISASAAATRSERGTGTGTGRSAPVRWHGRRWSSASADQNSKRSARTLAASHPAGSSGPGLRAALMIRSTCCSSRSMAVLVSSAARPGPSAAAFMRSAVSGVRSRCGRSADITRSAVIRPLSRSAIALNACPAAASSAGPCAVLRALRSPSPSSAGGVRELAGRPGDTGREPVGHDHRDGHQGERHARHHRPGGGHAARDLGGGDVDLGDRQPPAAERHRLEDGVTAGNGGDEGLGGGGRHAQVGGARALRAADEHARLARRARRRLSCRSRRGARRRARR